VVEAVEVVAEARNHLWVPGAAVEAAGAVATKEAEDWAVAVAAKEGAAKGVGRLEVAAAPGACPMELQEDRREGAARELEMAVAASAVAGRAAAALAAAGLGAAASAVVGSEAAASAVAALAVVETAEAGAVTAAAEAAVEAVAAMAAVRTGQQEV
jgi:hypothetical protein